MCLTGVEIAVVAVAVAGAAAAGYQASEQASFQNAQARAQAEAQRQALEYQAAIDKNNAQIAEWQRADAIERAEVEAQRVMLERADIQARQKAMLAASGVDVNEGTALNLYASTEFLSEWDTNTIQSNAAREAWGYEVREADLLNSSAFNLNRAAASRPATINATRAGAVAGGTSLLSSIGSYAAGGGFSGGSAAGGSSSHMRVNPALGGSGW